MKRIIFVLALFFLVACAKTETVEQSSAVEAPEKSSIEIKNFAFVPDTITVKRGATVIWIQKDSAPHTVKFDDEESPTLSVGDTWSKTFDKPGDYKYICAIHPSMKGRVIVK